MKKLKDNAQSSQSRVSSSVCVDSDLIGRELFYKSSITKCFTKFKVKSLILNKQIISNALCFSVHLISENNNRYTYEEDSIFTAVH